MEADPVLLADPDLPPPLSPDPDPEVDYEPDDAAAPGQEHGQLADADELYGDLFEDGSEGGGLLPLQAHQLKQRCKELEEAVAKLAAEADELREERDALADERTNLVRNISCLFKTAQAEIQRKDKELKELRQREERLRR